jgi:hypothetical protein
MNSGGGSELASLSPSGSDRSGNPSSVPEPSTLLMVLLTITGLAGQRIALWSAKKVSGTKPGFGS